MNMFIAEVNNSQYVNIFIAKVSNSQYMSFSMCFSSHSIELNIHEIEIV